MQNEVVVRHGSPWPWIILVIVLSPIAAFIIFASVALGGAAQAWQGVDNLLAGRLVMRVDAPAVVTQVQQLNRLETVSYTIDKVIEGGTYQNNAVVKALLGDRLLFIAHGEVVAGDDLTQLRDEDVTVGKDGSVAIRLPAAQVLTHNLDNSQSRVYDRQKGVLAGEDPNLETQVRQTAEQEIVQAACQGGILAKANANAQAAVRALLLESGIKQVTFLPPRVTGPDGCS